MVLANRLPYRSWNPLREWQEVQREFAKLLHETEVPRAAGPFPVELRSGDDGALLLASLPGFSAEELDIAIERDLLTLALHPKAADSKVRKRSFRLPFRVDADKTVATLSDGLLEVRLERATEDTPRKIHVNSHETPPQQSQED